MRVRASAVAGELYYDAAKFASLFKCPRIDYDPNHFTHIFMHPRRFNLGTSRA